MPFSGEEYGALFSSQNIPERIVSKCSIVIRSRRASTLVIS